MGNVKNKIQKEIEKIWPQAQKHIAEVNADMVKLMKKGEKNLSVLYAQAKKKTEELALMAKREELYYELGKNIAPFLTSDHLKNKNILNIYSEIQRVTKKLRAKK
jgi:hypothetical protein